MASVFKRKKKGNCYIIAWFDQAGRRREKSSRTTDRKTADRIAAKLESEVALRRDGVVDAKADRYATAARRPLAEHLADYRDALLAKGDVPKHVRQTIALIERVLLLSSADYLSDLTPSSMQAAVAEVRRQGRSLATCNHSLRAVKAFSRWLWRDGRIREDILAHLQGYNVKLDR